MSITRGIEIRRKDPSKDRPFYACPGVSWKDYGFDMWVSEWLNKFIPNLAPYETDNDYWSRIIEKKDLLRMADDLLQCRLYVCPQAYDWMEGEKLYEKDAKYFGEYFRYLAERLKADEMLIYYDAGC